MTEQKKGCDFCGDADMMILPLRYGVIGSAVGPLPHNPEDTLWKGVKEIDLDTFNSGAAYTVRPLRVGYVYMLLERNGVKTWQAYAVTKGAELFSFRAKVPPETPPKFSCDRETCGINASMIKIKNANKVNKAWMLFTPSPLTPARLDYLEKNPDSVAAMQTFSPSAWLEGNKKQLHSLEADKLDRHVAELKINNRYSEIMHYDHRREELFRSLFPPYLELMNIESTTRLTKEQQSVILDQHAAHLGRLKNLLKTKGFPAFVLYDAIGITQELNAWRNRPMENHQEWLQQSRVKNTPTNEHKLLMLRNIDDLKVAIKECYLNSDEVQDELLEAENSAYGLTKFYPAGIEKYNKLNKEFKEKAEEIWEEKAGKFLDTEGFRHELFYHEEEIEGQIERRTKGHIAWLESDQMTQALFVYDPNHAPSGVAYQDQVGLAVVGMTYTEEGRKLTDKWVKDLNVDKGNRLIRAQCYNQEEIIAEWRKMVMIAHNDPELKATGLADYFNQTMLGVDLGKDENLDPDGWIKRSQGTVKKLARHFDAIGKAIGENANNAWLQNTTLGKGIAIQGILVEKLLGFSMIKAEQAYAQKLLGTLAASLGRRALNCLYLDSASNPELRAKVDRMRGAQYKKIGGKINAEIVDEAIKGAHKNWVNDTSMRGNYFRVRTGVVIMVLEAANLIFLATRDENKDEPTSLMIGAAALSVAAATFELVGYGYRTILRSSADRTSLAARAADIGYGNLKLIAGSMALFAAGIGTYYSYVAAHEKWKTAWNAETKKEEKITLAILYSVHTASSAGFALISAGTSFADTAAFFAELSRGCRIRVFGNLFMKFSNAAAFVNNGARASTVLAAAKAGKDLTNAGKAMLYRFGAFNLWVFVAISIAIWAFEYYYLDELQEWCLKSCFKKEYSVFDKTKTFGLRGDREYFKDFEEEASALLDALEEMFGSKEKEKKENKAAGIESEVKA